MQRDALNLGQVKVSRLFRAYFVPTLLGMLALCVVTMTDGIFVGRGVGDDGLAAVNICIPPCMFMVGIGLMMGMGVGVVCAVHLSKNNVKAARINVTQALTVGTLIVALFLSLSLSFPVATARLLGSSTTLMKPVLDYMPWIFLTSLFQIWGVIGLFIIRLDGSPRYAMWCNILPGLANIVLDYVYIFPLGMGVKGAGIATCISCAFGALMVIAYLWGFTHKLKPYRLKLTAKSMRLTLRNIFYQCKIGISALIGETTMGVLMLLGNIMFMRYSGDAGVGAFSIACYYCPFVFMIGNAIAQSAQPIISYNYGLGKRGRVASAERLAIATALIAGVLVTAAFVVVPRFLVSLFVSHLTPAAVIASTGFPLFSAAFIFFIFNLTVIGYYQSVENVMAALVFALLRGAVFLIPAFIFLPRWFGVGGIWVALAVSEALTSVGIAIYYASGGSRFNRDDMARC